MQLVLGALITVLLVSAETVAVTFDTNDDFSMTLPSGWIEAPPEALRNIEAGLEELSQGAGKLRYDYGYQLASARVWFEYPYIIVQVVRKGRVPEGQLTQHKQLESEFRKGLEETEEAFGAVVSNMEQGETLYDENDHVLWSTVTMNVQGMGDVRGLVGLKLTEFGFIQLMGYATKDTFAQYSPIFREAVQTLAVADQYKYQPRLTDHVPTVWGINLGEAAIAGVIGGLGGGVFGLIQYLKKRRNRQDT
ncbi:MAG: hypothetical protein HRU37_11595 [Roseibacillus sp.]|nr:hypothetical protein [Roseibacillus sp.]